MPRNRFKDHNNLLRVSKSCIRKEPLWRKGLFFVFFLKAAMLVFAQVHTEDSNVERNHLEFYTAFERDVHPLFPRYFSKH